MKIICISDTHNNPPENLPEGDWLIHAGDATNLGTIQEVAAFGRWLERQEKYFSVIIAICGNHDFLFERNNSLARSLLPSSVHYLENSGVKIGGLKIWGSPITPFFYNWAFNKHRGEEIKRYWDMIPDDTNILITHGGPYQILDKTINGDSVGCEDLLDRVKQLKHLKLHAFGHIHFSRNYKIINGVKFVNAAIMDEDYNSTNSPIIIKI